MGPGPPLTPALAPSLPVSDGAGRGVRWTRGLPALLTAALLLPQAPAGQPPLTQCLQTPQPAPKTLERRSRALGLQTSPPRARPAPWPPAICSSGEAAGRAGSDPVLVPRLQPNRHLLGCFSPSRSQDPAPSSAPQEASGGGKVAEPSGQYAPPPPASPCCPGLAPAAQAAPLSSPAPCQALVSVRDLQATLRRTNSTPSPLDR